MAIIVTALLATRGLSVEQVISLYTRQMSSSPAQSMREQLQNLPLLSYLSLSISIQRYSLDISSFTRSWLHCQPNTSLSSTIDIAEQLRRKTPGQSHKFEPAGFGLSSIFLLNNPNALFITLLSTLMIRQTNTFKYELLFSDKERVPQVCVL